METYNAYRPTSELWLPEIPSHWDAQKMKYLFSERSEKGYPDEPLLVASQNMGVVPKNVYGSRTVEAQKDLHLLKLVKQGDFVISLRSFQGGIELAHYQGIISPAYTVMIPNQQITKGYFRYLAKSVGFIQLLKLCVTGIREGQNIDYSKLKNYKIPLPPRAEQEQIARFLDWKVSSVNRLIRLKRREIEALDSLKRSMVCNAVTRGLSPNAPMKYSGVQWLGDIPAHWDAVPLYAMAKEKSICDCADLQLLSVYLDDGVIPFSEREEKRTNVTSLDLSKYQRVDYGDFVLNNQQAWRGSVGISFHTGIVSPAYVVLSLNNMMDSHYADFLFRSRGMVDQYLIISKGVGSIQRNIYWSALKRAVVPVPPKEEQLEIVAYLKRNIKKLNYVAKQHSKEVTTLEEYKAKLIADVVTGKINVQDIAIPEYEFVGEEADADADERGEEEAGNAELE